MSKDWKLFIARAVDHNERHGLPQALKIDGYDDCVIGNHTAKLDGNECMVLVYSLDKMVDSVMLDMVTNGLADIGNAEDKHLALAGVMETCVEPLSGMGIAAPLVVDDCA